MTNGYPKMEFKLLAEHAFKLSYFLHLIWLRSKSLQPLDRKFFEILIDYYCIVYILIEAINDEWINISNEFDLSKYPKLIVLIATIYIPPISSHSPEEFYTYI